MSWWRAGGGAAEDLSGARHYCNRVPSAIVIVGDLQPWEILYRQTCVRLSSSSEQAYVSEKNRHCSLGSPTSVTIPSHGEIEGSLLSDANTGALKCKRFFGVPYAQPPVEDLRWRRPRSLPSDFRYDADGRKYQDKWHVCPQPVRVAETKSPVIAYCYLLRIHVASLSAAPRDERSSFRSCPRIFLQRGPGECFVFIKTK
jgi:hypothetical protein